MWKLRFGAVATAGLLMLATGGSALASSGGDKNAGDVWTDNVGQPSGPGHEQDPHLACQDINLWGSGLADSTGSYTIDGWPPSGAKEQDYSSTWSYDQSSGGSQIVSVINVSQLISAAQANHDAPVNKQGYHFKLQFSQDPAKHKTFWVNCTPPASGTSGSTTTTSSGSSSECTASEDESSNHSSESQSNSGEARSHGKGRALGKSKSHGRHKGLAKHESRSKSSKTDTSSGSEENEGSGDSDQCTPTSSNSGTSGSTTSSTSPSTGATTPTSNVEGVSSTRPVTHAKKHPRKRRRHHRRRRRTHRKHTTLSRAPVVRSGFTG